VSGRAPFGARTTYRVGGGADEVVEVGSVADLVSLTSRLGGDRSVYVLGRGSNTLVADAGFAGVVVHLGDAFASIETDEAAGTVTAGGAADLPVVARRSVEAGLTGFEWAVGVPGSVGGGVRMNAGGHGSDMAASVVSVRVFDLDRGEVVELDVAALDFGYRRSSLGSRHVVLDATLHLTHGDIEAGRSSLREIVRWRREHQPGGANCGSVFTNPIDDSAGRLIEAAGLKGFRVGTARVSEKHANFIQADTGGSGDDVLSLMTSIHDAVETLTGVSLRSEVRLVGFDDSAVDALSTEER